jgi:DNA (cytosine-5)-methyltransferase 1
MANGKDKAYYTMKGLKYMGLLKIAKPIRLIELFAGIGSQAKALKRLGADFEHYRICEFDKYAIKSYNAIHGTDFTTSNITEITAKDLGIVDTDKYTYICCYSFPCQDLSLAGKQKLMAKGSGTRSSLLWEVERLLNECEELPQILLMENVTQVHGKKNKEHFDEWISFLESKGYSNYWKDLNAKNFGIPQNRNRTFMVSVLGDYTYEFPKGFPLEWRLKDILEDEVDEKYYLSQKTIEKLVRHKNKIIENDTPEISSTIHAGYYKMGGRDQQYIKEPIIIEDFYKNRDERIFKEYSPALRAGRNGLKVIEPVNAHIIPQLFGGIGEKNFGKQYRQGNRIYDSNSIAMCLGAAPVGNAGGYSYLYVIEEPAVWDGFNQRVRADSSTIGTLTQNCGADLKRNGQGIITCEGGLIRIRNLTPKECFRLMGFTDEDFEKAAAVNSNTQLYKQAGNSIVVDVLCYIFGEML